MRIKNTISPMYKISPRFFIVGETLQPRTSLLALHDQEVEVSSKARERDFQNEIKKVLQSALGDTYVVLTGENLLYKLIVDVDGEVRPKDVGSLKRGHSAFETDVLIRRADSKVPLVVIELKYGNFNTHGIITYSSNAIRHKDIYPYLRYGFVAGGIDNLGQRFLAHNRGFDFAMSVSDLSAGESKLVELIQGQLKIAERLVEIMRKDRANFTRFVTTLEID